MLRTYSKSQENITKGKSSSQGMAMPHATLDTDTLIQNLTNHQKLSVACKRDYF